jgi:hypothetical protein
MAWQKISKQLKIPFNNNVKEPTPESNLPVVTQTSTQLEVQNEDFVLEPMETINKSLFTSSESSEEVIKPDYSSSSSSDHDVTIHPRNHDNKHKYKFTNVNVIKQKDIVNPKPHVKATEQQMIIHSRKFLNYKNEKRNDSLAKAIRHAACVISSSQYFRDANENDPLYQNASQYIPRNGQLFQSGWAQRNTHGTLYGISYVNKRKEELIEIFQKGEANSHEKMSPGQMYEALRVKNPNKFSIPSETEIKSFISAQVQKGKYKKKPKNGDGRDRKSKTAQNNEVEWETILESCVTNHPSAKSEDIFKKFIDILKDTN